MELREYSTLIRVYMEDTDAGGIVYYVNYLKYMERGRTECMRTLGFNKPAVLDEGKLLVVHSLNVAYRKPARLDDALKVITTISKLAKTNVTFHQQIWRQNELLCEADVRVACVAQDSMKPTVIPLAMKEKLAQNLVRCKSE